MTLFISRSQAAKHAYCRNLFRPRWPTQVPIPAHRNTNIHHPFPCQPAAYCLVYFPIQMVVDVKKHLDCTICLNVTLASTLKEESDDEYLQRTHTDNKSNLDHAEVDNALLCA